MSGSPISSDGGAGGNDADFMNQLFGSPPSHRRKTRPASAQFRPTPPTTSGNIGPSDVPVPPSPGTGRLMRPQSARPSTTHSRASRFNASVASFVATPSHLQRSKLHQSRTLEPPVIPDGDEEEVREAVHAAAAALRKKMTLLEVERRAVAERHRWEAIQAESELGMLAREHADLLAQVQQKHASHDAEAKAHAGLQKLQLKAKDPFATATSLRSRAVTGRVVQETSVLEAASQAAARRSFYDPNATVGISLPTNTPASVAAAAAQAQAAAKDPQRTLKLRKAYDLLRHTSELKQKQFDTLANELEMMILKVKSGSSSSSSSRRQHAEDSSSATQAQGPGTPHTHSSAEDRAAAMKAFNPFLMTLQSLHSRLQSLMTDHNSAMKERGTYTHMVQRLTQEQSLFTVTLQKLEQSLRAREVEFENLINFLATARGSEQAVEGEKNELLLRLTGEQEERQVRQQERERTAAELKAFFASNALRERETRQLQYLKEQEEKSLERGLLKSRMQSRAMSRMPSGSNSAFPPSSARGSLPTGHNMLALMPGSPRGGTMNGTSQALVLSNGGASGQQQPQQQQMVVPHQPVDPNELFLSGLTAHQQTITRAFLKLEQRHRQIHGATISTAQQPSSTDSSRSHSEDVDLNLLISSALQKIASATSLKSQVSKAEHSKANLQQELTQLRVERDQAEEELQRRMVAGQEEKDASIPSAPDLTFLTTLDPSHQYYDNEDEDDSLHLAATHLRSQVDAAAAEAERWTKKKHRVDTLLSSIRAALKNMADALGVPEIAGGSSGGPSDSFLAQLHAPPSPSHASEHLSPPSHGHRRGVSASASSFGSLSSLTSIVTITPSPGSVPTHGGGHHAVKGSVDFGAGETGHSSTLLTLLNAFWNKLVDTLGQLPASAWPPHLAEVHGALKSTAPLWPQAPIVPITPARSVHSSLHIPSSAGPSLSSGGGGGAPSSIREEDDDELQEDEVDFPVHRSPQDEDDADDADLKLILSHPSAAALAAESGGTSKHTAAKATKPAQRPYSAF